MGTRGGRRRERAEEAPAGYADDEAVPGGHRGGQAKSAARDNHFHVKLISGKFGHMRGALIEKM